MTVDATHHVKILYEVKTKDQSLILKFGSPGQNVLSYRFRDIFAFDESTRDVYIKEYTRTVVDSANDVRCSSEIQPNR